ncbi:hypothetical protein PINS_up013811 [Pythium insidiosum]|nr:hypothetical protein PINS_up013811 [Pythium insidiosum]
MLLLTDAVSADQNGAHATNLISSLQYWGSSACASASPLAQLVALNVAEALVHPRAPPLVLNFDSVVAAHTAPAGNSNALDAVTALGSRAALVSAPAVRGRMDWDEENNQPEEDADMEKEPEQEQEQEHEPAVVKRAKTESDANAAEPIEQTPMEEDVEEDFDDERPVIATTEDVAVVENDDEEEEADASVEAAAATMSASASNDDDDDDDEFPDIVVDDADE